jgi:hypothetical protein
MRFCWTSAALTRSLTRVDLSRIAGEVGCAIKTSSAKHRRQNIVGKTSPGI